MRIYLILLIVSIGISGCTSKPSYIPNIVTEYQKEYIPVSCIERMPIKPYYTKETPTTAKDLAAYYAEVETLLIKCVKKKDMR